MKERNKTKNQGKMTKRPSKRNSMKENKKYPYKSTQGKRSERTKKKN